MASKAKLKSRIKALKKERDSLAHLSGAALLTLVERGHNAEAADIMIDGIKKSAQ